MTIQQEAYELIEKMPDEGVVFLVDIIKRLNPIFMYENKASESTNTESYNEASKKLQDIAELEDDWNGNGASAFSKKLIHKMRAILISLEYQPEVFPTACDSIQIEYDGTDGSHLEFEITESDMAEMYYITSEGLEQVETIPSDAKSINMIARRFYGRQV